MYTILILRIFYPISVYKFIKPQQFKLFKIQLPEERRQQLDATIGLESYLSTRYPKSLRYSKDQNAFLLDIPENVAEFHETVQRLCSLPSGGFQCKLSTLEPYELDQIELSWLEERVKLRVDLFKNIPLGLANKAPEPTFNIHQIRVSKPQ
ncbi:hypothetical protein CTM93_00005 [Photobacterium phosphoreum]|uniref:hypothetical protein n=1 Tax=Photobacterium phosphoreum TaxID=659 RepID=UPI000D180D62|nr:hypothetical protein [Photobacterium phosphoreum]PSU86189.1 hypothetical protein CTM93_00005 [Photobacterium phosphoreum]